SASRPGSHAHSRARVYCVGRFTGLRRSVNTATVFTSVPPLAAGWRLDHSYARLPDRLFARVSPTPVAAPHLVVLNRPLAEHLGLEPALLGAPENAGWFTGN